MSQKKLFVVYDGRAILSDTDDASVVVVCDSLQKARREAKGHGECAIYEYDVAAGDELVNEHFIEATKS